MFKSLIRTLVACIPYLACISAHAFAQNVPITSSGLNTQVSGPISVGGHVQYDITGGTRPDGGPNLFHSFGEFGVPNNAIANFLNNPHVETTNILGRVTGRNISNIFGTIQTDGFGSANLFLMNPAGFLFGPNAAIHVGGMVSFTSADYLQLQDGVRFNAIPSTADALLSTSPVAAFGFLGSNPEAITVQGSHLAVTDGTGISLVGGNITIESGANLSAPNGKIQLAGTASPGAFDALTLQSIPNKNGTSFTSFGTVTLGPNSTINVSGTNNVSIRGGQFVLSVNDATLNTAENAGTPGTVVFNTGSKIITSTSSVDPGVDVRILAKSIQVDGSSSGIFTDTLGSNAGGDITLTANSITLKNTGTLSAMTSGNEASATSGTIILSAAQVVLNSNASISSGTSGKGNAGRINIAGTDSITFQDSFINNGVNTPTATGNGGSIQLASPSIELHNSRIRAATSGRGDAGNVDLAVGNLALAGNSQIQTRTTGGGNAGNISIHGHQGTESAAKNITFKGSLILSDTVGDTAYVEGNAGDIFIHTDRLTLTEGSGITTSASASSGSAGNITINATDSVTISQSSLKSNSEDASLGDAGKITITAPHISVENEGMVTTSTDYIGNAGDITFKTASLQLTTGGHLNSSSVNMASPSGHAGTIIIEGTSSSARSVTINGAGSGIFTETQGKGKGPGGSITVNANQVQLDSKAAISANSSGAADAGNIDVTATNGLTMQNGSSITTRVVSNVTGSTARGGDIKVTTSPTATVNIQDSTISASVPGSGDGGNVAIDPHFVILQNGRILSQTDQGTGGNIKITARIFLPDAGTVISADATRGVNGTVTIQSPYAPAGGKIQPMMNRPLQATLLFNQRCVALAGGEFSSFTMVGNRLPIEPGGWLSSPLALVTSESHGDAMNNKSPQGSLDEPIEKHSILSLRQIAPPGFLTKALAANRFADCRS